MLKVALLLSLFVQDVDIYEAKYRFEKKAKKIDGVVDVSVGGLNGKLHVVARVSSDEAEKALAKLTRGTVEGHPLKVIRVRGKIVKKLTGKKKPAPEKPVVRKWGAGTTVAAPRKDHKVDPGKKKKAEPVVECDIERREKKLKPRYTNVRQPHCVWVKRTVFGPGSSADPGALLRQVKTPEGATPWRRGVGAMGSVWSCWYPRHRKGCPKGGSHD